MLISKDINYISLRTKLALMKALSVFAVLSTSTILFMGLISTSFFSIPMAYAQQEDSDDDEISFRTSADSHDMIFFGEGVVQVVITDPNADDDGSVEDISVNIDASPESGSDASISVTVPETSDSSGRFELYLAHDDAAAVGPDDLEPINTEGIEGDGSCVSDCAPFVTFGPSGDLQVDSDLYEEVSFDLLSGDSEITLNYEETLAQVELDRSAYGSDSFVYVFIDDQDANLNPSATDEFVVDPNSAPNSDLLELDGGSIDGTVTFRETGDNTARFEGRYQLGSSIIADSESLVLTLFDKANYGDSLGAKENDSDITDEISFVIGNDDGTIDVGGGGGGEGGSPTTWDAELSSDKTTYALGDNVTVTIEDPDANANPDMVETVDLQLSASNKTAIVDAIETGQDTGVFEASFQISPDGTIAGTGMTVGQGESITATYLDEKPADYRARIESGEDPEQEFELEIKTIAGGEEQPSETPSATMGAPTIQTLDGSTGPFEAGSQLTISTTIGNDNNAPQPFVGIVEVRDSNGITVYIAWQGGDLEPDGSATIGVSWIPEISGEYEIRTFAVSSLSEGLVLSEVASRSIDIA